MGLIGAKITTKTNKSINFKIFIQDKSIQTKLKKLNLIII